MGTYFDCSSAGFVTCDQQLIQYNNVLVDLVIQNWYHHIRMKKHGGIWCT
jgi:hypothetical protein